MLKLIKNFEDLFTKIEHKPKFSHLVGVIESYNLFCRIVEPDHPLSLPKAKRRVLIDFLSLYRKNNIITSTSFYISVFNIYTYQVIKFLYLFLKNEFNVCLVKGTNHYADKFQFTRNSLNAETCFYTNEQLKTIPSSYVKKKFTKREQLKLLSLALKYSSTDCWHIAQFLVFEQQSKEISISANEFIFEEGGDYTIHAFLYVFRKSFRKVILTIRTPYIYSSYSNLKYDKIVTNTLPLLEKLTKNNKITEFRLATWDAPIAENSKKSGIRSIGFFTDMGNYLLNKAQKIEQDTFILDFAVKQDIFLYITIHPQERTKKLNEYALFFRPAKVKFREDESVKDFLDGVDIVVGWWSTLVFQAYCQRCPVILLDFNGDNQGSDFQETSCGMIQRAKSGEDFYLIYNYFKALSTEEKNKKFDQSFDIVFSKSWR